MSVSNPLSTFPQTTDPAANVNAVRPAAEPPSHVRHDSVSPEQVAPLPKAEVDQQHIDRRGLIAQVLQSHPQATPDEIVKLLADRNIQVSAALVLAERGRARESGFPA